MESYEVQLKDFKKAEQELTGKERVFISQDNNTRSTTIDEIRKPLAEQLNENMNEISTVKTDYAKKTDVNTLASNKAEKTDLQAINILVENLDDTKANKTDLTQPFNFKGACLSTELPTSANVNDTYYCTDLKYRKTWNGSKWYQSSMQESDYTDELGNINNNINYKDFRKNIIASAMVVEGKYINANGWIDNESNSKIYTIPVVAGEKYVVGFSAFKDSNAHICFTNTDTSGARTCKVSDLTPISVDGFNYGYILEPLYDSGNITISFTKKLATYWEINAFCCKHSDYFSISEKINLNNNYCKTIENKINNPLQGKKWVAIGDSLSDLSTLGLSVDNYITYVSKALGLEYVNLGKGGTGYVSNAFDTSTTFAERVNQIPLDADIITIFGSFNDVYVEGFSNGNIDSTELTTLCGCMKKTLDAIIARCPDAIIGIITPTPWDTNSHRNSPARAVSYVDSQLNVANYYSLPVLNLFEESNLRPWEESFRKKYYRMSDGSDGVHPNTLGHNKFITPKVINFIYKLLGYYIYS